MENSSNNTNSLYLKFIAIAVGILCLDRVFDLLIGGTSLFVPLIIAVFLSFILNPLISLLEKIKIPHVLSVALSIMIAIIIIFSVYETVSQSFNTFLSGFSRYSAKLDLLAKKSVDMLGISPDVLSGEIKLFDDPNAAKLMEGISLSGMMYAIIQSLSTFMSEMIMAFLFLIFILLGRGQLIDKIEKGCSENVATRMTKIYENINEQVQKYLVIKTLVSLMTSGAVMIILYIFDVDFVLVWGILTFLFNFIPNIGSFIASIFPLLFAWIQFDNSILVIWLAVCLLVTQFIFGNIVEPKIMGNRINLSPVLIIFSLLFWGLIWGIPGMFLSVPLVVIIKIIFENIDRTKPLAILMSGRVEK